MTVQQKEMVSNVNNVSSLQGDVVFSNEIRHDHRVRVIKRNHTRTMGKLEHGMCEQCNAERGKTGKGQTVKERKLN